MADEGSGGIGYWWRWQVPVCALIFAVPAAVAAVVAYKWRKDPLRAGDLWLPCWRRVHPLGLLVYRAVVFVFMSFLLSQVVRRHGPFAFYFYTQWTFALVIVYFALGTLISAYGCWTCSKQHITESEERNRFLKRVLEENRSVTTTSITNNTSSTVKLRSYHEGEENVQGAGFWGHVMQIVYQISAGAVMLTDIVFWGLLVPGENFGLSLLMGCMHSLNLVFLIVDSALNSLPFPWFRMAYFVLWSCTYVIFQWILHACGFSWWPYPFLELATPWAPFWYFCLALVHIPCYVFYFLIVKAKNSLFLRGIP